MTHDNERTGSGRGAMRRPGVPAPRCAGRRIARSILVIIFHLLAGPAAQFRDLGPGYYDSRISRERKISNHVRQFQAIGLTVTIEEAA